MSKVKEVERIESLLKDFDSKEIQEFEDRGLSIELSDLSFTLKEDDNTTQRYNKILNSFKKKNQPSWLNSDLDEINSYFEKISFGYLKFISIRPLKLGTSDFEDYLIRLVRACSTSKRENIPLEDFIEKYSPIEIKFSKNGVENVGYSLLKGSINFSISNPRKSCHNQIIGLKKNSHPHVLILDSLLFAGEVLVNNTFEKIALRDEEITQYLVTKEIVFSDPTSSQTPVPTDESFRKDIIDIAKKYKLLTFEQEHPYDYLNKYKDIFYLNKDENGFLLNTESFLFRKIIIPEFISLLEYVKTKIRTENDLERTQAKVYETKKNIKKETLELMQTTIFNEIFGYIEIDDDVDVKKFKIAEQEIINLREKVPTLISKDHSLRFKKLGRHHAEGQYYPGLKAMIVDVRKLKAYVHEDGHRIDKVKGGKTLLSERINFRPIADLCKKVVQEAVEKLPLDHPFRKDWYSTTKKYNRFYYFQNSEIFARCYELHLFMNLGIRSSLMEEKYDAPDYAHTPELLNLINEYYTDLLNDIAKSA